MSSEFVLWTFEDIPNALVLKDLQGLTDAQQAWKLQSCGRFDDDELGDLSFTADPDYPNDLLLVDTHGNSDSVIPVSPALKEFIGERDVKHIQFIPLKLLDHRNKVAAEYFILQPNLAVDCLDWDASKARASSINPERITRIRGIVIDESKVPADAAIFRVRNLYATTLIRRSLAHAISDAGFTGADWMELGDFTY